MRAVRALAGFASELPAARAFAQLDVTVRAFASASLFKNTAGTSRSARFLGGSNPASPTSISWTIP